MTDDSDDVGAILARRHDNGADFWAAPGGKIYVGNPYSTLGALNMLHELGMPADHEAIAGGIALVRAACRDDGRIRLGPKTPLYPCYTAEAARVLCRYGLSNCDDVTRTVDFLTSAAHEDGGWRCGFKRFGTGPETVCSNPGATLYALDVLRFRPDLRDGNEVTDRAVETLLEHWSNPAPRGPCHWGIGSRFMRVEFPFLRYNLFYYVYVLSFYDAAVRDARFREAYDILASTLNVDGKIVIESLHRRLKGLRFCAKAQPSDVATQRFNEICSNLN